MRPVSLPLLPVLAAVLLWGCASPPAPDPQALLARSEQATGTAGVKTLTLSGRGTGATFGQAWQPGTAWPALNYTQMMRVLDLENGAFREDFARSRAELNGGGAVPPMGQGEAKASGFARDGFAWNGGATPVPSPVALDARVHDLWTSTPQAALRAARRQGATAGTETVDGQQLSTLSFSVPGQFSARLFIDDAGLVTRIASTMPHPVLGDTAVLTRFSDYRDFGGVKVPMHIRQSQGGFDVLDLALQDVTVNAPAGITVPDAVRSARENVSVQPVADGVWFLAGGSHNSVAIEMADRIVLVESPLYDGRAAAVFSAANALVPGKTVRTVINSHHHFDHAGGLRYAASQGVEIITSDLARPYFERVFAQPNSVAPDALARSGRTPVLSGFTGKRVLTDATRTVEIHALQGSVHAQGFNLIYLPREKLAIEADAYTPGPPGAPRPPVPNPLQVNLVQNFERLGLPVERILPLHGRVVPVQELYAQIGR